MWNFGNILLASPQTNVAVAGQTNVQLGSNAALFTGGQLIGQGAGNWSGIGQQNIVV